MYNITFLIVIPYLFQECVNNSKSPPNMFLFLFDISNINYEDNCNHRNLI